MIYLVTNSVNIVAYCSAPHGTLAIHSNNKLITSLTKHLTHACHSLVNLNSLKDCELNFHFLKLLTKQELCHYIYNILLTWHMLYK